MWNWFPMVSLWNEIQKKHLPGVFIHCILNLENPHYQHRGQRNIQVSLLHSKTKKYNNKNKIIDIPIE